ncbi:MAG: hypothetical protein HWE15_04915 [Algoriphagus sp.]|uniref:hypothetical protein n=1 Tax=Algoriphagus sp. TaxID=1872435 RepID=UPI00181EABB7|nr:hypothetical protein [Algoriphagus sp.]NVJ85623.1 hypothetical protein [Algoriphagus sp.]
MRSLSPILAFFWLIFSCQTYKPIASENLPETTAENHSELIEQYLSLLEKDADIKISTKSGRELELTYESHTSDTLYAKFNMPKNKFPTKIALQEIDELKVSKPDIPLTILLSGLTALGIYIMIDTAISNMNFGGFSF